MTQGEIDTEWSRSVAGLAVDALVRAKIVGQADFDRACAIVAEEILVRLCLEEAEALGVPMVVGSAVRQMLSIATASEGPTADMTELVKNVEKWAGVRVGG